MKRGAVLLTLLVLAVASAAGFWLRMTPWRLAPGTPPGGDRAYHLRMVDAVARTGRVAPLDPLSNPPGGRATARLLPVGMYQAAGWMHRALGGAEARLERDAAWFAALAGALIVWPVWLLARAIGLSRAAALLAALLAAVMPAHVHRTYSGWLRYDGPGTLLALFHVALLASALAARGARARRLLAGLAGLAMVAALAVWRVVVVFPLAEAALLAVAFVARGVRREARETFTIVLVLAWAGAFAVEYLREQGAGLSSAWLAALLGALAAWLPLQGGVAETAGAAGARHAGGGGPGPRHRPPAWLTGGWTMRAGAVVVAAALGAWLGRLFPGATGSDYAPVAGLLAGRLRMWLHPGAPLDPLVALLLGVDELQPVSPAGLARAGYLFWCAPLLLVSGLWLGRRAWRARGAIAPGAALTALLCVAFTAGTLMWDRTKVLLAPFAAIAVAALFDAWRGAGPPRIRQALRVATTGVLAIALAGSAWASWRIVTSRTSPIDADLAATYAFLRDRTEPGAVLLGPWERGYELQAFTAHPAVMDGLLESGENQRRILAFARAAMAQSADSLAAFCDRYDARYVLVPPSTQLYGVALLAGAPFLDKLIPGIPLTPGEADRTLIRMMVFGRDEPGLRKVFEQGDYRVYRRETAAAAVR